MGEDSFPLEYVLRRRFRVQEGWIRNPWCWHPALLCAVYPGPADAEESRDW